MLKKIPVWVPVLLFVLLSGILLSGLLSSPTRTQWVPQLNKPVPHFSLPTLQTPNSLVTQTILIGKVSLVTFWATWCPPCEQEHGVLIDIAKQYPIFMLGINYKDQHDAALRWLLDLSNPYTVVLTDYSGRTGIDWGVLAVPETFIVDKQGIIRYKHTGPLTWQQWENELWPLVQTLCAASA